MQAVTLSPKFQVVIPLAVRTALGLKAGEKIQVIPYRDRIELVPVRPIVAARGFLRGIETDVQREPDRS
jgi:AbrB family looped-hinge helix DNA binding protein